MSSGPIWKALIGGLGMNAGSAAMPWAMPPRLSGTGVSRDARRRNGAGRRRRSDHDYDDDPSAPTTPDPAAWVSAACGATTMGGEARPADLSGRPARRE